MIFQRSIRQQAGLLASSSRCSLRLQAQSRAFHRVPQLTHGSQFKENGVPGVLSPEGYELAWVQYQSYLVQKLNMLTGGTADENIGPGSLLIKYARQASMASLFNYASMAHNNHFYFNCLSPTAVPVPQKLEEAIVESCSSVESLKEEFVATANAMFGPGFVWLVKMKDTAQLKILATYIAGSPYPQAHFRRQPVDMATQTTGVTGGENLEAVGRIASRTYGSMGPLSQQKYIAPGGADIHPILCVNTWEHVWLRDWGIGGKAAYLDAWWDKINWEEVAQNYKQAGSDMGFDGSRK
ncbi:Fe superoxide dismutase [Arthroderma uncinatum]|uniref:Fe superoxide dismutase n=1 Tax=Arthroderma uncinatum TaxID=74035 RepID=UPI00144AE7F8|nr:Fe superoxide dismutase [Arthroderma uncinatum]KAF3482915.1 Fe superoxide dismutase [Arthroderma uncinatum]